MSTKRSIVCGLIWNLILSNVECFIDLRVKKTPHHITCVPWKLNCTPTCITRAQIYPFSTFPGQEKIGRGGEEFRQTFLKRKCQSYFHNLIFKIHNVTESPEWQNYLCLYKFPHGISEKFHAFWNIISKFLWEKRIFFINSSPDKQICLFAQWPV